jgi:hypothetical protein
LKKKDLAKSLFLEKFIIIQFIKKMMKKYLIRFFLIISLTN